MDFISLAFQEILQVLEAAQGELLTTADNVLTQVVALEIVIVALLSMAGISVSLQFLVRQLLVIVGINALIARFPQFSNFLTNSAAGLANRAGGTTTDAPISFEDPGSIIMRGLSTVEKVFQQMIQDSSWLGVSIEGLFELTIALLLLLIHFFMMVTIAGVRLQFSLYGLAAIVLLPFGALGVLRGWAVNGLNGMIRSALMLFVLGALVALADPIFQLTLPNAFTWMDLLTQLSVALLYLVVMIFGLAAASGVVNGNAGALGFNSAYLFGRSRHYAQSALGLPRVGRLSLPRLGQGTPESYSPEAYRHPHVSSQGSTLQALPSAADALLISHSPRLVPSGRVANTLFIT